MCLVNRLTLSNEFPLSQIKADVHAKGNLKCCFLAFCMISSMRKVHGMRRLSGVVPKFMRDEREAKHGMDRPSVVFHNRGYSLIL